ncbi:hypothetical protein BDN72DRAFT_166749 [Pluteus cervinus]|uniref:Uncharacterized protein n=1 Tax=Pluteus cervinus TaxID=181527 RepID=A0ACD3B7E2_9AGAR|nr:hypothetical protein BDN72DRAFT_166749 [Pluteus cervinus]
MFLCRRLLAQSHAARIIISQNSPYRVYPNTVCRTPVALAVRYHNDEAPDRPDISTSPPQLTSKPSLSPRPRKARSSDQNESPSADVRAYIALQNSGRPLTASPPQTYIRVISEAIQSGEPFVAGTVLTDIAELDQRTVVELFNAVLVSCDIKALPNEAVVSALTRLQERQITLDGLTPQALERLLKFLTKELKVCPGDDTLLSLLCPIILTRIRKHHAPYGAYALTYHPPSLVHASFYVISKLLQLSQSDLALEFFRVLVDQGQIPSEAIKESDGSPAHFDVIIYSALVRASLHWNWRSLTAMLLRSLLALPDTRSSSVNTLVVDVIYALLDTPTVGDIRSCNALIRKMDTISPVPDGLIRRLYTSALQLNQGHEAEALYAFTREERVLAHHSYPPPHGGALPWLLNHIASRSNRTYLARQLVNDVVDKNLSIPVQFRAQFISNAASKGFGSAARTLWERYTTDADPDRAAIVGHSALMIRMISLFSHIRKRTKLEEDSVADENPKAGLLLERSKDLNEFLDRILFEYRQHHEPLSKATHHALTSLARACFILGRFTEGFETFNVLLRRKEVPDLYDVNVALTAIAERRPQYAAILIDRMIERGMVPDMVTYGTVLHHALLHKDEALVEEMVRRARGQKGAMLSLKSVAGLVRARVAGGGSVASQRSKLEEAWVILSRLKATDFVSSPQVGKFLVFSSLRAQSPSLAFNFWKLLLRESTAWNDREQVFQRKLIREMVQEHQREGLLDEKEAADMLVELRKRGGIIK